MINEQMALVIDTLKARLKVQEEKTALLEEKVARLEGNAPANGTRGSMTIKEPSKLLGWVTTNKPNGSNVRAAPRVADDNPPVYTLTLGQSARVVGIVDDPQSLELSWYVLDDGNYVRDDVVTFSDVEPVWPSNFVSWPSPVHGYTITNHDGEHGHDGIDLACKRGTPIYAGPNGGVVVKAFACETCNPDGDGAASLKDIKRGYGYGRHVIVRYGYTILPQKVKDAIPLNASVYAIYAHLNAVMVQVDQVLEPYQQIGTVGATGNTYGNPPDHLHLSLRYSDKVKADWYTIRGYKLNPTLLFKVN